MSNEKLFGLFFNHLSIHHIIDGIQHTQVYLHIYTDSNNKKYKNTRIRVRKTIFLSYQELAYLLGVGVEGRIGRHSLPA